MFRKKFDKYFSKDERLQIVEKAFEKGIFEPVIFNVNICRDPKDNKFLNLAIDSHAVSIITGDNDLLILNPFQSVLIMSPSDFLKIDV